MRNVMALTRRGSEIKILRTLKNGNVLIAGQDGIKEVSPSIVFPLLKEYEAGCSLEEVKAMRYPVIASCEELEAASQAGDDSDFIGLLSLDEKYILGECI